jgi:dolichyl-phosphate-mannose-protein mannosyltransferase
MPLAPLPCASMIASKAEHPAADTGSRLPTLRARLAPAIPGSELWGWLGPLLVTAFGAFLRFNRLSVPRSVIFDETYYVPDAYGILRHGVEQNYVSDRNSLIAHGHTNIFTTGGEFVVHPPLGKLFIAAGEWMFGLTPFGWRFSAALIGSLAILLLARIARRMTRSTLLGCVAGLLLSLDGLEFVMSRTALLDIFLMFWVLAAFGCLVVDRDVHRARLAGWAERHPGAERAPRLGFRWWRLAGGICLGLALASKWDAIWSVVAFAGLTMAWDMGALRAVGLRNHVRGALADDGRWLPVSFVLTPLLVYLASWSGWFATSDGWDRNWAAQNGDHTPVISALASFVEYQKQILSFHLGLTTHHPYQSQPWDWLVINRPVAFMWQCPAGGVEGTEKLHTCASGNAQEVLAMGTPLIWWMSIVTLLVCLIWWLTRRDWRAGAVLLAVAASWLPWFWFAAHDHRTEFYFYAVAFDPYLVLSITLCLGLIIGSARASAGRRVAGSIFAGAYVLGVLVNFAYIYPILAGKVIPYAAWLSRMWYHGWI